MDYSKKIAELKAQKAGLVTQADAAADAGKLEELTQLNVKISEVNNQIAAVEQLREASGDVAQPENNGAAQPQDGKKDMPFASLGEQLRPRCS